VDVLPAGRVVEAAGEGELRPVLREDHPLGFKDDLLALLLNELLGLGVDEDVQLGVGVVGPVASAGDSLGVVEGEGPIRLGVGEVGEEGHVEVAVEDGVADEGADLDLVELNVDTDAVELVLDEDGHVNDDGGPGELGQLHLDLEAVREAGLRQELLGPLRIMAIEGAQLLLGKSPLHLGPLDGAVVEALTVLDHVDHVVPIQGEIDGLAHPDVVEGGPDDLHVDDGIEEGGVLVNVEATVVDEILGLRLGEDGAVDVVVSGAEGGHQGRAFLDDDEPD
jgi:hypothetical protein